MSYELRQFGVLRKGALWMTILAIPRWTRVNKFGVGLGWMDRIRELIGLLSLEFSLMDLGMVCMGKEQGGTHGRVS